jgi:glycosyltransferase involved in cell wall biosynthesis
MSTETQPVAAILSDGETATTDYFLIPHLVSLGYQITWLDCRMESLPPSFDLAGCRMLVISRYLSGNWRKILRLLRQQELTLVYFMDDDLFDIHALSDLPIRYQWKIATQALRHRSKLMRMCDEFWVSTPHLAEKYARLNPILLNPAPSQKTMTAKEGIHVCYHGTASHQQEIEWLVAVINEVQLRSDNIHFELFGTSDIKMIAGGLSRVSVLLPMTWTNYLAFTSAHKIDIALAPLLPSTFNAARGSTKFYDYARMGAVGLYSHVSPYREFIRDGVDGLLLENDPAVWVDAILKLAQDQPRRQSIAEAVKERANNGINARLVSNQSKYT